MKFHYDKKVDALYLRFLDSKYTESDEVREGVILDYDRAGKLIGVEILDASKQLPRGFYANLLKKRMPLSLTIEAGVKG